jgi:hypothetical protein
VSFCVVQGTSARERPRFGSSSNYRELVTDGWRVNYKRGATVAARAHAGPQKTVVRGPLVSLGRLPQDLHVQGLIRHQLFKRAFS